jgi:hypothetical protein
MLASGPSGVVFLGDAGSVEKLLKAEGNSESGFAKRMFESDALSATMGVDKTTAAKIATLLSEHEPSEVAPNSHFITETRFNKNGLERRTTSDFGLIGWIISQLGKERDE